MREHVAVNSSGGKVRSLQHLQTCQISFNFFASLGKFFFVGIKILSAKITCFDYIFLQNKN